jgi:molybdopterin-synthase adenylyltransferase
LIRPRLKTLNCLSGPGSLLVSVDPRTRVELEDPDGQVLEMLRLLWEGTRSLEELHAALSVRWPNLQLEEVEEGVQQLDAFGWLEDNGAPGRLTDYQRERYFSNLAFFDAFTNLQRHREDFQLALLRSSVLVLGTGGLGSSVLQNLAGFGVGRIKLIDFDRVELKNLARQFTYNEAQIGSPKVEQVAAWLSTFNSQIEVNAIDARLQSVADLEPHLQRVDLVVSAIDQPDGVDLIVNEACVVHDVPFIRGGLAYMQGLYWSVNPGSSACRQCLEHHRARLAEDVDAAIVQWPFVMRDERPNRATGPIAQMLGALVAMEAARYLTGFVPPVSAATYHLVDFSTDCSITTDSWSKAPECKVCKSVGARRAA